MDFLEMIQSYGPYIGLPIIVYFLVQGLKSKIPFFQSVMGQRIIHFLPVVLGMLGGLLLPEETWQEKVLTGGGLGCLNLLIYKFITVSLASTETIEARQDVKDIVNSRNSNVD